MSCLPRMNLIVSNRNKVEVNAVISIPKEKETKSIRDIRIHKNKNPLDFENDTI